MHRALVIVSRRRGCSALVVRLSWAAIQRDPPLLWYREPTSDGVGIEGDDFGGVEVKIDECIDSVVKLRRTKVGDSIQRANPYSALVLVRTEYMRSSIISREIYLIRNRGLVERVQQRKRIEILPGKNKLVKLV